MAYEHRSFVDKKPWFIMDQNEIIAYEVLRASYLHHLGYLKGAYDVICSVKEMPLYPQECVSLDTNRVYILTEMGDLPKAQTVADSLKALDHPAYCCLSSYILELQGNIEECLKRVQSVRDYRLSSPSAGTVKLADTPTRFHVENMPKGYYIVVPEVSSEKRKYIPIGFLDPYILSSNLVKVIPNAEIYHFGVLTSNVHMAWVRAVCGRLKSDYRYSNDIVYNNFPWPSPTDEQKKKIEQTAQAILDARVLYPDCSLADLYDEVTMPPELRKAHQANDRAVMQAYGFDIKTMTESTCVAELMKMYQKLVGG